MKSHVAIAMALALVAVIFVCPAMACTMPSAHSCCHKHHPSQGVMRNCPLVLLENGKAAPLAVIPAAVVVPVPVPFAAQPAILPVAPDIRASDIYLRNRVLLI